MVLCIQYCDNNKKSKWKYIWGKRNADTTAQRICHLHWNVWKQWKGSWFSLTLPGKKQLFIKSTSLLQIHMRTCTENPYTTVWCITITQYKCQEWRTKTSNYCIGLFSTVFTISKLLFLASFGRTQPISIECIKNVQTPKFFWRYCALRESPKFTGERERKKFQKFDFFLLSQHF